MHNLKQFERQLSDNPESEPEPDQDSGARRFGGFGRFTLPPLKVFISQQSAKNHPVGSSGAGHLYVRRNGRFDLHPLSQRGTPAGAITTVLMSGKVHPASTLSPINPAGFREFCAGRMRLLVHKLARLESCCSSTGTLRSRAPCQTKGLTCRMSGVSGLHACHRVDPGSIECVG